MREATRQKQLKERRRMEALSIYRFPDIMGNVHWGSSAYGADVKCIENCEPIEYDNDGFKAGPRAVRVIDIESPAKFIALEMDSNSRSGYRVDWKGEWVPSQGWDVKKEVRSF